MEEIIKNLVEKISSYNIWNNLFPGIVFVVSWKEQQGLYFLLEKSGRICLYIILQE